MVRCGELRGGEILPAQQSRCEGPVGQKRDLTLSTQRQLPLLNVSIEQVIGPLVGDNRGDFQRAHELAVRGIAEPNPQRLPLLLQGVEPLELPLPAFQRFVQLYQIHIIRRQTAQGRLE